MPCSSATPKLLHGLIDSFPTVIQACYGFDSECGYRQLCGGCSKRLYTSEVLQQLTPDTFFTEKAGRVYKTTCSNELIYSEHLRDATTHTCVPLRTLYVAEFT